MSNPSSSRENGSSLRRNILACLTKLSHGSAPFISTFILIHLTAPVMANIGGSSLSSQTMLLGREYYQTGFGEKYLVLGPLALHVLSGTTKRLLSPQKQPPRPLSTLLSWAGYSAALFFLPIHFMTHRVHPTATTAPISGVGPSELDYEFVKLGLQKWPLASWFLYTGLVCSVALHMADGTALIWSTYFRRQGRKQAGGKGGKWYNRRTKVLAGVVLPVLAGLYAVSKEPLLLFSSMARRYEAVFNSESWIYRL
ncbi:hypothetical protein D9615_001980 [Tricholomella constricta]|uniref:Mitochondrial adapter protein MCP1 transmembrane domain-containing protein n=1 Tax=Tricholomella constricta TaxID=117010 RepID=A0A8H5HP32_9AGAR|nr:hypothetical protein D9615_001980 [Tricholomella constricta]